MFKKNKRIKLSPTAWRKLRDYVHERDGCCQICGSKASMAPAHVVGRGAGGDDSPANVVWLCSSTIDRKGCHEMFDSYEVGIHDDVYKMLVGEPDYLHKTY